MSYNNAKGYETHPEDKGGILKLKFKLSRLLFRYKFRLLFSIISI